MTKTVYLEENNSFIKLVGECGRRRNNGLITLTERGRVWLSMKLEGRSPCYLIGEIKALGGDFVREIEYRRSSNGHANCAGGTGYQGGVPFLNIDEACRYLSRYFNVRWCNETRAKEGRRLSSAALVPQSLTGSVPTPLKLFKAWIKAQRFEDTEMIATENDRVTAILRGTPPRLVRSSALKDVTGKMASRIKCSPSGCAGALYFVYRRKKGQIDPLYVGIARTNGKRGASLSCLVKSGHMRFGDHFRSGGHIGNMNDALRGVKSGEAHWVAALFRQGSTVTGVNPAAMLRDPVYVHFDLWDANGISMTNQKERPTLEAEEKARIKILRAAGYGKQLLNRTK